MRLEKDNWMKFQLFGIFEQLLPTEKFMILQVLIITQKILHFAAAPNQTFIITKTIN